MSSSPQMQKKVRFKEGWVCYIYDSYTPFIQEYITNCLESKKFYLQHRYIKTHGTLLDFNFQRELQQSEEEEEGSEEEDEGSEEEDEGSEDEGSEDEGSEEEDEGSEEEEEADERVTIIFR